MLCCTFYAHPRLVPDAQTDGLLLGVTAVRLCGGQWPVVLAHTQLYISTALHNSE